MEKFVEQSLLYDFYGELLTAHQRAIYEEVVLDDCSLTEVAENHQISRQGVYDMIHRCDKSLCGYEQKLKLVERFLAVRQKVYDMQEVLRACKTAERDGGAEPGRDAQAVEGGYSADVVQRLEELADEILEEL